MATLSTIHFIVDVVVLFFCGIYLLLFWAFTGAVSLLKYRILLINHTDDVSL